MKNFFSRTIGFGRYPNKTVVDVFCRNRPYFDQILHKNGKFRREYAEAFQKWINEDEKRQNPNYLSQERVLLAVELMGADQIRSLFQQLIEVLNEKYPYQEVPKDLDFMKTINHEKVDLKYLGPQMSRIELFWSRIAIPEVWLEA
ncbi:MAG: hypothetical protein AAGU27_03515 [Dehalobacterium sp.]